MSNIVRIDNHIDKYEPFVLPAGRAGSTDLEGEMREVLMDEAGTPWIESARRDRVGHLRKRLSQEADGPHASLNADPDGYGNLAHFHTRPQFQVLLRGRATFAGEPTMTPIAVHYSDARTPYGPFTVDQGAILAVLRRRPAKLIRMSDRSGRQDRDPDGREFFGHRSDEAAPGADVLFAADDGTSATLHRLRPGASIPQPARCSVGAFQVVIAGSALIGGASLGPHSMRYLEGEGEAAPAVAGGNGCEILDLCFGDRGEGAAHAANVTVHDTSDEPADVTSVVVGSVPSHQEGGAWQRIGAAVAEGEMTIADVDGRRVCLARVDGRVYAFDNGCTHARADLNEGELYGHHVECPWHGGRFDVRTGEAVLRPARSPLETYRVRAHEQGIEVFLNPRT